MVTLGDLQQKFTTLKLLKGEFSEIKGICSLYNLQQDHLCLVKNQKFYKRLLEEMAQQGKSSFILLLDRSLENEVDLSSFSSVLCIDSLEKELPRLSKVFFDDRYAGDEHQADGRVTGTAEIDSTARIAAGVFIGQNVKIGAQVEILPGCVVMNRASIGAGTKIYPNVTIYEDVRVGERCRIHAGTTIGADGFGYQFEAGVHKKIWHFGSVIIGSDVEIGANVSVDRATFDFTVIGDGCKIDNQVQIGHNCRLGRGVIMCGQSALAGSVVLGDFCVLAGRAGVGPDIKMGMGCQIAAGALVSQDWPAGSKVAGHPARSVGEWMRSNAYLRKMALQRGKKD